MNTARRPMYAWQDIPWYKVERAVFKLQQRIYRASRHGDVKTVHKLQRLLMKSWYAKLLATRRGTQDNRGKRTAGVYGVKSLTPPQRLRLAQTLSLSPQVQPNSVRLNFCMVAELSDATVRDGRSTPFHWPNRSGRNRASHRCVWSAPARPTG